MPDPTETDLLAAWQAWQRAYHDMQMSLSTELKEVAHEFERTAWQHLLSALHKWQAWMEEREEDDAQNPR